MTRPKEKDTILLEKPKRLRLQLPSVTPSSRHDRDLIIPLRIIPRNSSAQPPLDKVIRIGRWSFIPNYEQRNYIRYLIGLAIAVLLGVAAVVIYLVAFQTRPPSAAAQSGIKGFFTLNLQTSTGSGEPGSQDGFGSDASFDAPSGVVSDSQGNVYVSDTNNNAIRKINTTGFVSTLAGNASQPASFSDGSGSDARFNAPLGITVDSKSGLLYVVDSNNSLIGQVDPANGAVLTIAGNLSLQPYFQDGQSTSASFSNPYGIAYSGQNLYVSDYGNNLVRKINGSRFVSTMAGVTGASGRYSSALSVKLDKPLGIAVDAYGSVYFYNQGTNQILKISPLDLATSEGAVIAPFVDLSGNPLSSTKAAIAIDSNDNLWILQSQGSQEQSMQVVSLANQSTRNVSLPPSVASIGYIAFKPNGDLVSGSNNLVLSFSIGSIMDTSTTLQVSSTKQSTLLGLSKTLKKSSTQSSLVLSSPTATLLTSLTSVASIHNANGT